MNTIRHLVARLAVAALILVAVPAGAAPVGTAFTYQGELKTTGGTPITGSCSFQFRLWDAAAAGTQVGTTQTVSGVAVTGGLFTVTLDFGGGMFAGSARWLEISVQGPGDGGFTLLAPRQPMTPAPYALYALAAPGGGFALPFAGGAANQGSTSSGIDALAGIGAFEATNTATTGLSHGLTGKTTSTWHNATGVLGVGLATTGYTSGVQGYATASATGTGVVGQGQSRGGWFQSLGAGSYAVEGVGVGRGVTGSASAGDGVYGSGTNSGLYGDGTSYGVVGNSLNGFGVYGTYGLGFFPPSGTNAGVYGLSASTNSGSAGVRGENTSGIGVQGTSTGFVGVWGTGQTIGTRGSSTAGDGVWGESSAAFKGGVVGFSSHAQGWAGYFKNVAGGLALVADGEAQVKTLQILGADLAESFPVREVGAEPGTVMMLDGSLDGRLRVSDGPYSRRVAGVVSGANGLAAGVVLHGESFDAPGRAAVALSGRVWVKCDATRAPIRVGDLLTTSDRPGYAMVAQDPSRAYGATLGKAMTSLDRGTGMVLVLVSLQ
jgi:hypothetical protein